MPSDASDAGRQRIDSKKEGYLHDLWKLIMSGWDTDRHFYWYC